MTVLIGDPVEFDDLLSAEGSGLSSSANICDAVSTRIGQRLKELKVQVDRLALEKPRQLKDYALQGFSRAAEMLQQLDWESHGINSDILSQNDSESSERQTEEFLVSQQEESVSDNYNMAESSNVGIVSRIQSCINSTEFMGFAAKGVIVDQLHRVSGDHQKLNPLRAWKQHLEASYGATVNLC